jgi:uncharacterized membrane protein
MGAQQLRGFVPWIVFAVVNGFVDWRYGALAALVLSLVFLATGMRGNHRIGEFVIEISTAVFFVVIAIVAFADPASALQHYTAALAMGWLALTSWGSLALGRPFTQGIARGHVPRQYWTSPEFVRTNRVITTAWSVAFTVACVVQALIAAHGGAEIVTIIVQVAGFVVPASFTRRYTANAGAATSMGATS